MDPISRRRFAQSGLAHCAGLGLLAGLPPWAAAQSAPASATQWAASWAGAPLDYLPLPIFPGLPAPPAERLSFGGQSLRQRMVSTLGGSLVRVRFSNLFGRQPLHVVEASVALSTGAEAVSPASLQRLRFGGRAVLTIAPGQEAWSDGTKLDVAAGQAVAVSYQVQAGTPFATRHLLATTSTVPGAAVMRADWRGAMPSQVNHVVTGLDVAARAAPRVIVAFGDSITQGAAGVSQESYPDRLAARLRDMPKSNGNGNGDANANANGNVGHGGFAVINAGIGGNRLLLDGTGPRALDRFKRDALGQSGVTHVLVLIGINDIGVSLPVPIQALSPTFRPATVEQLTAGLQQLIDQARQRGVKLLLGTITPFKGAAYWSEEKEVRRQALNRWIRGRQEVDGVIDFDEALRDPADPSAMRAACDSGDHLHPGPAGYAAMADAIDLRELRE
ncbi:SGNH/GDSL hydrolase family protein [Variovorax sp. KK3]|uniref:SGNH/GDSL hydrolase family protein n=1 Tax=Variovorax sp. KK3 TaxID=1855728 RepID=UPI0009FB861F|nr:SGNH/GDSL hydrolase family protein [Variovorax sp. KK3]